MISENPELALEKWKIFYLEERISWTNDFKLRCKSVTTQSFKWRECLPWSPSQYVQEAVKDLERELDKRGIKLRNGIRSPPMVIRLNVIWAQT